MEHISLRTRIKSHYHWVVAAVVLLEFAVACGFSNNLYSLYLIPITEELGVSRSAFSVSPSIRYLSSFFSNLIFAMFYNRHGYRKLATFTFAVTGCMYLLYSRAQNLIPFYLGAAIVGVLEAFYSTASASRMITESLQNLYPPISHQYVPGTMRRLPFTTSCLPIRLISQLVFISRCFFSRR